MDNKPTLRTLTLAMALTAPVAALAHEGHGLWGPSHWHATDVLGFIALGAGVAALLWWRNRK